MSEGEKQYLLTAQVGEGLLFAGQNHVTAQFIASQYEYDLITSKPQDIIDSQNETIKEEPVLPVEEINPFETQSQTPNPNPQGTSPTQQPQAPMPETTQGFQGTEPNTQTPTTLTPDTPQQPPSPTIPTSPQQPNNTGSVPTQQNT